MISKRIATGLVAATLALPSATAPARADGGDVLGGLIVGGIIGSAIANDMNRKKQKQRSYSSSSSGISSAQREQNREVQIALNHFGFPVGSPDGSIGPKSRAAISEYQAMLGYPATGQLTEYERTLLVGSYHRAVAGGALTMQQAAQNPMGMKGLLITWRDESLGLVPQQPAQPQAPATTMAVAPAEPVPEAPAAPEPTMAATPEPEGGKLPSFFGTAKTASVSLASECNRISLTTSTSGYTTAATMNDPKAALGEQFCLARGYAIAIGEELVSQVQGFSPEQIAEQCAGLGPALADNVNALSLKPAADVIAGTQSFVLASGMAPADLAATARICLSVGYQTDNMQVAEGSALVLATLGETAYGELLGHHVALGYGSAPRPDLALGWYDMGLAGAANPTTAVFAPGQSDRLDLIRRAAYTLGGKADQAALPETQPAAAVPTFKVPAAPEAAAPVTEAATAPAEPAEVAVVQASDTAAPEGTISSDQVSALPLVAQLPFLLFSN